MLDFIHNLANHIPVEAAVVVIAGAVDFILRIVPSSKPLSIAYLVADMLHAVGRLFDKVGDFLDKILPQRIKQPKP